MLWRNIFWWEFFHFTTLWKNEKFTLTDEKFRQITSLVLFFCNNVAFTKFFRKNRVSHKYTVWKNDKFSLTKEIISSNQLFSTLFSKTINFTKFLPKMRERGFPLFSHCEMWKNEMFTPHKFFSSIRVRVKFFTVVKTRAPPRFESYRNARQAVVWLGLQVNFKYHEIIKFFRKNAPPGIDPAIPWVGGECLIHWATESGLSNCQKLCNFIVHAKKTQISEIFYRMKEKILPYVVYIIWYSYLAIWGAVTPNNSWCPYL